MIYKRAWELLRLEIEKSRRQTFTKMDLRMMALRAIEQAIKESENATIS